MAGTDTSIKIELRPAPAVILCEPQLGENIGTAARAMANFGLWDLRLVVRAMAGPTRRPSPPPRGPITSSSRSGSSRRSKRRSPI